MVGKCHLDSYILKKMSTKYRLTSNVNDDKTALGYDYKTDFDAFLNKSIVKIFNRNQRNFS